MRHSNFNNHYLSLSVHSTSQFQFKFDISFLVGEEFNKFVIQIFFY